MRIIYYSYWGTYAAYTMAALHTGFYKPDCLPTEDLIEAQFEMCHRYGEQYGNLIFVGLDNHFREVYCLGSRQHAGMVVRALQHISRIFHIEEPVHFIYAGLGEGKLPRLLQRPVIKNTRFAESIFKIWFKKQYRVCLKEVEHAKQALKDGINQ